MDEHNGSISPKKRRLNEQVLGACMFMVGSTFLAATSEIPKFHENCAICNKNTKTHLRKGRRLLYISKLSPKVRNHLETWCSLNNKKLLELEGLYICGKDRLKLLKTELTDMNILIPTVCGVEVPHIEMDQESGREWQKLELERIELSPLSMTKKFGALIILRTQGN